MKRDSNRIGMMAMAIVVGALCVGCGIAPLLGLVGPKPINLDTVQTVNVSSSGTSITTSSTAAPSTASSSSRSSSSSSSSSSTSGSIVDDLVSSGAGSLNNGRLTIRDDISKSTATNLLNKEAERCLARCDTDYKRSGATAVSLCRKNCQFVQQITTGMMADR